MPTNGRRHADAHPSPKIVPGVHSGVALTAKTVSASSAIFHPSSNLLPSWIALL
jgi:hypothetical protein